MSYVRIALAQLNSQLGNTDGNLARAAEYIARAAQDGCHVILFPELYLQGYRADGRFYATALAVDDERSRALADLAATKQITVIMGTARKDTVFPHLVYNSALIYGPVGFVGSYDKVHLGTYLQYKEGLYFAPGGEIPTFETTFGPFGVQICYDASYPEVSRTIALSGAPIQFILSAGGREFKRTWDALLTVRSLENAMFSIYVNVVGPQADDYYFGGSRIVGPDGQVVISGPEDVERLVCGEIDLQAALDLRYQTLRFRDRAPWAYRLGPALGHVRDQS